MHTGHNLCTLTHIITRVTLGLLVQHVTTLCDCRHMVHISKTWSVGLLACQLYTTWEVYFFSSCENLVNRDEEYISGTGYIFLKQCVRCLETIGEHLLKVSNRGSRLPVPYPTLPCCHSNRQTPASSGKPPVPLTYILTTANTDFRKNKLKSVLKLGDEGYPGLDRTGLWIISKCLQYNKIKQYEDCLSGR